MEIKIAPGALPDDMTQDELDELLADMQKMVDDGTLFENSIPLDMEKLKEEDPEIYEQLMIMDSDTKVTLN